MIFTHSKENFSNATKTIQKLARHFNEDIIYAIIGRGINKIEQLIRLLETFDKIGHVNTAKAENKEIKSKENGGKYHRQSNSNWRAPWSGGGGNSNEEEGLTHQEGQTSKITRQVRAGLI